MFLSFPESGYIIITTFIMEFSQEVMTSYGLVALVVVLLLLATKSSMPRFWTASLPLPPGPPGHPILGHLKIFPSKSPEEYAEWSREYNSDILSFRVLGRTIMVLNAVKPAVDLLDKRGANYCDRPQMILSEIMGFKKTLTFLRYGPEFHMHRRILQRNLQKSNIAQHRELQEREMVVMLQGIVLEKANWETALRRFATAIALGIGFGIRIESDDDPFIQVAADASYALSGGGSPLGSIVNFFPLLRYLPSRFHDEPLKFANDWRWAIRNLHDRPYEAVLSSNKKMPSLMPALVEKRKEQILAFGTSQISDEDIKGAAGAVYVAGQDTTYASLVAFVVNMVLHPEIQRKARSDLVAATGGKRLPNFEDRPKLRYIDYIVQETLRWCPVTPMGVPHRSINEDIYRGQRIPAGAIIYANAKAMTHDERIYQDPDNFDPDRYIPKVEGGRGEPFPVGQFGFGRRVCVGQHLAEANMWIAIAGMLSALSFCKARDENGNEITPVVELTTGLTSHPKPFPSRIVPWDKLSVSIVSDAKV